VIPTLRGRLQTRLFAVIVIGGVCTALVTPLLPGFPPGTPMSERYVDTFSVLAAVLVLGIFWEFVYHFLQQFRWEKDWPTLFGLLTFANEVLLVWFALRLGWVPNIESLPPARLWITHFVIVWIVIFGFLNGPMKVVFIRWRFRGGRLVGP